VPLSGEMVAEMASSASSRWWDGTMEVGREMRRYFVILDIAAEISENRNGCQMY
jgi:hypothetical protein